MPVSGFKLVVQGKPEGRVIKSQDAAISAAALKSLKSAKPVQIQQEADVMKGITERILYTVTVKRKV